jgi:hypothetical protein
MYLVQVSLILLISRVWVISLGIGPCFPSICWRIVQILHKRRKKTTNTAHNYSPLVISGNDKNKQLTLLGQHQLALTGKDM